MPCRIYRVICKVDLTFSYVGQTRHSLEERKKDFIGKKIYLNYTDTLQNIIHTDDDFIYEELEYINDKDYDYVKERYYINKFGLSNIGMKDCKTTCSCGQIFKLHPKHKLFLKHQNSIKHQLRIAKTF